MYTKKGVFMIYYLDAKPVLKLLQETVKFIEHFPEKWIKGAHYADSKKRSTFLGNPNVVYYDMTGMLWMCAKKHNIDDIFVDFVIKQIMKKVRVAHPECDNLSVYNDNYAESSDHFLVLFIAVNDHLTSEATKYGGRFRQVS